MRNVVKYVCHDGEEVWLSSAGAACSEGGMFDWEWDSRDLNGRTASMYRKKSKLKFRVAFAGASAAKSMDALARAALKDAEASKPGRLYVGEWYVEGFVSSSKKKGFWPGAPAVAELTVSSDSPLWTREATSVFRVPAQGSSNGIDHPCDFPHDYGHRVGSEHVENGGGVPAPVRITIQGPANCPRVSVGGNVYGADVRLAAGEFLVIDGAAKTVARFTPSGGSENVFGLRAGIQRKGSGSYVFEQVKAGQSAVSWNGSFPFSITVYERSQEPRWSLAEE